MIDEEIIKELHKTLPKKPKILKVREWLDMKKQQALSRVFLNWNPVAKLDLAPIAPEPGMPTIEIVYPDFKYQSNEHRRKDR
jgi:hypothetical protein